MTSIRMRIFPKSIQTNFQRATTVCYIFVVGSVLFLESLAPPKVESNLERKTSPTERWLKPVVTPTVSSFVPDNIIAGNRLEVFGTGFSVIKEENKVLFTHDQWTPSPEATAEEASETRLLVRVPFGSITGPIQVKVTPSGSPEEISQASVGRLAIKVSVSGFAQDASNCAAGTCKPVKDVTISNGLLSTKTDDAGEFVLAGVGASPASIFDINGQTATPPYTAFPNYLEMEVLDLRDNFFPAPINLIPQTGPPYYLGKAAALAYAKQINQSAGEVSLITDPKAVVRFPNGATSGIVRLNVYQRERAPVRLPLKHFSSTIVQIAPFGVTINPGAKLIFPNNDGIGKDLKIPANDLNIRLFRYDRSKESPTAGRFVDAGPAHLINEGRQIETEPTAIRETSYYFVSTERNTGTLQGRVRKDLRPVKNAIVVARGQSTLSDAEGQFVLASVPVIREDNDQVIVEVYSIEPGRVIGIERAGVSLKAGETKKLDPDIMFRERRPRNVDAPLTLLAPSMIEIQAGKNHEFNAMLRDAKKQNAKVMIEGVNFARLVSGKGDSYKILLTPKNSDIGNYNITLTASASGGRASTHRILLSVSK
jgi:hypothetical protein